MSIPDSNRQEPIALLGQDVTLVYKQGQTVAVIKIEENEGSLYQGKILSEFFPLELRFAFLRFEEIVNKQMFSYLDEVESLIESFNCKVCVLGGEFCYDISELQIYLDSNNISFRIASGA